MAEDRGEHLVLIQTVAQDPCGSGQSRRRVVESRPSGGPDSCSAQGAHRHRTAARVASSACSTWGRSSSIGSGVTVVAAPFQVSSCPTRPDGRLSRPGPGAAADRRLAGRRRCRSAHDRRCGCCWLQRAVGATSRASPSTPCSRTRGLWIIFPLTTLQAPSTGSTARPAAPRSRHWSVRSTCRPLALNQLLLQLDRDRTAGGHIAKVSMASAYWVDTISFLRHRALLLM
jgi:hypothetical protein